MVGSGQVIEMKICTRCGEPRNIKEFSWKIKAKNLRSSWCKLCQSQYDKQYYSINRDKRLRQGKKYQKNNLEKYREGNKRYRDKNPEKYREICRLANKKYRRHNLQKVRDRHRLWMRKYREDNPEKIKEWTKRYNSNHVEEIKEQQKRYRKNNPDKVNARNARRRAQKLQATPTNANKKLINFYYKVVATIPGYGVDHWQPIAKGGLHHEDNLQILENTLNSEKRDKWPLTEEEKVRYKGFRL